MKAKNKVILGSALAIAMSASMIAGTTFALFTSESSVNVAVTSAKVGITAKIEEGESKSTLGGEALGKFSTANGIALENIAPGDVYSFTVKAENSSSIAINYRTAIEFTNPVLASALDVTIGDVTYSGLTKYATAWTKIEEPKGAIEDLEVEIAFPALEESQNQFQNLSTDIKVMVEGVQGNTVVSNADSELVLSVNNGAQLEKAVKTAKDLKQEATINLVNDIVLPHELYISQHTANLTINGNGYEVTADEDFGTVNAGQWQLIKINQTPDYLVTLNDITLKHVAIGTQSANYHTLDVWGSKVELNNVTLVRDFASVKGGAAMVINGAQVTATDLHIVAGGSAWGGINVDAKNGPATLTLKSGFGAAVANNVAVWCENGAKVVDEEGVLTYNEELKFYATTVLDAGTEEQFVKATYDVSDNGVINLTGDFTLSTGTAIQAKNVTLNGNGHTITLNMPLTAQGIVFGPDGFSAGKATVRDLTINGKANYGLFIANRNSNFTEEDDVCLVENVTVTGQYQYAAVCFPNNTNAVVKNCHFENNLPDDKAEYARYGIGSMGVFTSWCGKVTFENSTADTLFVNNPANNHTKVYLTKNSVVNAVLAEKAENAFCYSVDENSTAKYFVLCRANSLPLVIGGEHDGELIDWELLHA